MKTLNTSVSSSIYYNTLLTHVQKLLLLEIERLTRNKKNVEISNQHLSSFLNIKKRQLLYNLRKLELLHFIKIKKTELNKRLIEVSHSLFKKDERAKLGGALKCTPGVHFNAPLLTYDSSSSSSRDLNNNINININTKKEKEKNKEKEKRTLKNNFLSKIEILKNESIEVLLYLNKTAHRNFTTVQSSLKEIKARLTDRESRIKIGSYKTITVDICKSIIDMKCKEWLNDEHWSTYLRPSTLFNYTKFYDYLDKFDKTKKIKKNKKQEKTHELQTYCPNCASLINNLSQICKKCNVFIEKQDIIYDVRDKLNFAYVHRKKYEKT